MLLGRVNPPEELKSPEQLEEDEKALFIRWSHLDMAVALGETRKLQPAVLERSQFNPEGVPHSSTCPGTDFANELHAQIMENMGLYEKGKENCLKYFIGVKGPADAKGIDCWFEYSRDDGNKIFALVDHTENPKKENPDVDYILFVVPERDTDNGEGYKKFVAKTAEKITEILETKEPTEELQYE